MESGIDLNRIPSPEVFKTLSPDEQEAILALDTIKEFKKGDYLLKEGAYFKESFFVVEGLVRQFHLYNDEEKTTEFYTADQSIYTSTSAFAPKKSNFSLVCLEDSRVSVVSFETEIRIYKKFPRFQEMCRIATEQNLLEFQGRFQKFISQSPEERYLTMLDDRPELLERVPQYHLASYLGVKPESLSRIRKRLARK